MAIHKYYAFRIRRKNILSPTPDACSLLLALSVFIGAGQPLQCGEVSDSNFVVVTVAIFIILTEIKLVLIL